MTLFAIPFTCSLAVRLWLAERGVPHTVEWMKRFEHVLGDGRSYDALNPKRRVPALLLPDGELLTEIVAVLTFLDEEPADAPARPARERRRHREWLCYVATELHRPSVFALFDPATPPETLADVRARLLPPVIDLLEDHLSRSPTLLGGDDPSPADLYLLWAALLLRFRHADAVRRPALDAWHDRLVARPAVARVLAEERAELALRR